MEEKPCGLTRLVYDKTLFPADFERNLGPE
jgi:hypothetical protein